MNNFFAYFLENIKRKKTVFIILIALTLVVFILGIFAAINFSEGVFIIDLSNISYIKFLKDDCSFLSLIFGLTLSLFVFVLLIFLCGCKRFLFPLSVLFYLYLAYSQIVIIVSLITIYGLLNCIILVLLLMIFSALLLFVMLLILLEILNFSNAYNYFSCCFNYKTSKLLVLLLALLFLVLIFGIIIGILKSFVLLLIF